MNQVEQGKVYRQILKLMNEKGGLVFMQVDPPEVAKQAKDIAKMAESAGLDAFAVGGSVGAQGSVLDETILALKENSKLPVILFPGNIATLSRHADAIYYMYLMNSLDPYYISGAQIAAAYPTKQLGLEVIPTAYIIVEPGRAVGWVGRAQVIPRNLPYLAGITALGGQFMGAKLAILESGGGADSPAPAEMVSLTKKMIDIPLIVAGGVRDEKFAYDTVKAGADIIHVGTAVEHFKGDMGKAKTALTRICEAARKAGKEKN